jgi:sugar phosphate isomerase/epimerase
VDIKRAARQRRAAAVGGVDMAEARISKPVVALQMYTVRDEAQKDFVGTLKAVAAMGYPAVQFAGTFDLSAKELRRVLDDLGLKVAGAHVGFDALESQLEEQIAYFREVGTIDLVVPALPQARRADKNGYRQVAESMNAIGQRLKDVQMRLSYHNHAFEFERFDGAYALDLLLEWCPPDLLKWEPDVYWIKVGGEDSVSYIRKYSGRCPLIHLKDMSKDESRTFAEVGEGIIDWPPIFEASEKNRAEWYVVEQDRWARPSLEAAKLSLQHLKEWGKV